MKFPVLWCGLCYYTEAWGGKFSEILATINPRVNIHSLTILAPPSAFLCLNTVMQRTANENAAGLRRICKDLLQILHKPAAFSFVVLCIIVFRLFSIFGAVGLFRSDMLLIFSISVGQVLSVRSLFNATMTWYSGFEFHLGSSPHAFSGWLANQRCRLRHYLLHRADEDPTRSKQLSTVAILGFQFGLYHVVVLSVKLST